MSMYVWITWALGMAIVWGVVPALVVFFVVRTVRRKGWSGLARQSIRFIGIILAMFIGIARAGMWLIRVSAEASADEEQKQENEANEPWDLSGGSYYNYRTGRFDSGRDPAGRYPGIPEGNLNDYWRED